MPLFWIFIDIQTQNSWNYGTCLIRKDGSPCRISVLRELASCRLRSTNHWFWSALVWFLGRNVPPSRKTIPLDFMPSVHACGSCMIKPFKKLNNALTIDVCLQAFFKWLASFFILVSLVSFRFFIFRAAIPTAYLSWMIRSIAIRYAPNEDGKGQNARDQVTLRLLYEIKYRTPMKYCS